MTVRLNRVFASVARMTGVQRRRGTDPATADRGGPPSWTQRLRGGALGVEAEVRVIVRLPEGVDAGRFRIDALDRSFSVVLDNARYYRATDGTVYGTREALARARRRLHGPFGEKILEIVTAPIEVVPGDVGRADGEHVLARVEELADSLQELHDEQRIQDFFPPEQFAYSDEAREAVVLPDPAGMSFTFRLHFTAGVPITRMHEFLSGARNDTASVHDAREHLADGLNFGNEIAARYASTLPEHAGHPVPPHAVHLLAGRADVSALRGFLALVYGQVAPIVHGKPESAVTKARAAAASRTSLAGIRETLPDPVREFLENEAAGIRQALIRRMEQRRPAIAGSDPLSRRGLDETDHTIDEYLYTALLPERPSINQDQALGVDTHFQSPDTNDGRLEVPLVLVELRSIGEGRKYRRQTIEGLRQQYESIKSMAQRVYEEATAVERAPHTTATPSAADATVAALTTFGDAATDPGTVWVRQIESVLVTAWRLDPVLRGVRSTHVIVTEEQVERIVRATSAVLRGDGSHAGALAADLSAIHDGLELAVPDEDTEQEWTSALEATGNVIAHLRRVETSTRSRPSVDRGGIRPVDGVEPPAGKGRDAWHTVVRPVTEGPGTYDGYDVSVTGSIRLAGEQELSPDSWVRYNDDFVHLDSRMSLRGVDGRIERIAEETRQDLLGDDTLVPHTMWADEEHVYLMPESGGQVIGLPLVVAEPAGHSPDIAEGTSEGADIEQVPSPGSGRSETSRPGDSGTPALSSEELSDDESVAPLVRSAYRVWPGDTAAASVGRLEQALVEAGPGSISLVVTPHATGERLVAANLDGTVTWMAHPSGLPAARPVDTMRLSLDLGPDATLLNPTDAMRQLDPGHAVFGLFQRIHASLTEFVGQGPGHARPAGTSTAATPATGARRLRGGYESDFTSGSERSFKSSIAENAYQVLTGSKRGPESVSSDESASLNESDSSDEDRDWQRSSYSDLFCVEVAVAEDGIGPGMRST